MCPICFSVSSAPEEDSPGSGSLRSVAHSDEPSSVFASTAATPTDLNRTLPETSEQELKEESVDESTASAAVSELTLHEEEKKQEESKPRDSPTSSRDTSRIEISEVVTEPLPVRAIAPLAEGEDIADDEGERAPVPFVAPLETRPVSESDAHIRIAHKVREEHTSSSESSIVRRDRSVEQKRNDICPWEDE